MKKFKSLSVGGMLVLALMYSCRDGKSQDTRTINSAPTGFKQTASATAERPPGNMVNFTFAARKVTAGVVHVRTTYANRGQSGSFFGQYGAPSAGSGSGVTISSDGYIATNNHVVENASRIEVVYPDRRGFTAKLVGRDPDTDLALLKVEATDLPYVVFGNSDDSEVGEWVLAVGYPYSLNTTVTAGIISAKGRSIGIINRSRPSARQEGQLSTAIESFIQTDAAINPGNSGGALVNLNGELIGINTAIASMTGSYAGYAFAVPVNLAKKILEDLKAYGKVQRGLLGVSFPMPSVEEQYLRQKGIDPATVTGVYIIGIQNGSAADEAGLREGDIIQQIDSIQIASSAEFSERIARHRPGDKVELTYLRDGRQRTTTATLKGEESQPAVAGNAQGLRDMYNKLGAKFSNIPAEIRERYNLRAGVIISEVTEGGFFDRMGVPEGTIVTYINGRAISDTEDVDKALSEAPGGRLQIIGIAPDGTRIAFNISLGT